MANDGQDTAMRLDDGDVQAARGGLSEADEHGRSGITSAAFASACLRVPLRGLPQLSGRAEESPPEVMAPHPASGARGRGSRSPAAPATRRRGFSSSKNGRIFTPVLRPPAS